MAKNWLPDSQNLLDHGTPSNEFYKYTKHFYLRQNKTKKGHRCFNGTCESGVWCLRNFYRNDRTKIFVVQNTTMNQTMIHMQPKARSIVWILLVLLVGLDSFSISLSSVCKSYRLLLWHYFSKCLIWFWNFLLFTYVLICSKVNFAHFLMLWNTVNNPPQANNDMINRAAPLTHPEIPGCWTHFGKQFDRAT